MLMRRIATQSLPDGSSLHLDLVQNADNRYDYEISITDRNLGDANYGLSVKCAATFSQDEATQLFIGWRKHLIEEHQKYLAAIAAQSEGNV